MAMQMARDVQAALDPDFRGRIRAACSTENGIALPAVSLTQSELPSGRSSASGGSCGRRVHVGVAGTVSLDSAAAMQPYLAAGGPAP